MEPGKNSGVKIVFGKLEDYIERCRKRTVPVIFFTVREGAREDKRLTNTVEITAMDYSEQANLIFSETNVSAEVIQTQDQYDAWRKECTLRLYGGDVEVIKEGKKETISIKGIIPYIQGEYAGAEIKAGWIGW